MKELLQTLYTELKYLKSQGQEAVYVDEDSMQILNKLIAKNAKRSVGENDFVKELSFVNKIDINAIEEVKKPKEIRLKVVSGEEKEALPSPKPFEIVGKTKEEKWESLRDIVFADELCKKRMPEGLKPVFGVGNLNADIFFCGDAPSEQEELQGEPFVDEAGQKLNDIIKAMGLKREDVYLSNIMNWRRKKEAGTSYIEEMNYCLPYLKAQIEIVKPKLIVGLGLAATIGLLGAKPKPKMEQVRGTWQKYMQSDLTLTYHPAYLVEHATNAIKRLFWEDMLAIMEKVDLPISERQQSYFLPKQ